MRPVFDSKVGDLSWDFGDRHGIIATPEGLKSDYCSDNSDCGGENVYLRGTSITYM